MKNVALAASAALLLGLAACVQPPVVRVDPTPVTVAAPQVTVPTCRCDCSSAFKARVPQIGSGCWVQDDVLVCPLVHRQLEVQPAYPAEDPRCEKLPDGSLRCEVHERN